MQKYTKEGTPYFTKAEVLPLAIPNIADMIISIETFLESFDSSLNFMEYAEDFDDAYYEKEEGSLLAKFAGQLCYASFSPKRTRNDKLDQYIEHILESQHGSVLEHANYSFLFYGISRSQTHELVRHRAGFAYSQISQRYVDGKVLRFVERPEFQADETLHALFEDRIDRSRKEYEELAKALLEKQKEGSQILSDEHKTSLRKKVNQAARALLPNETEAPIVVTGNARAWRHFLTMRGHPSAEVEIRTLASKVYKYFKDNPMFQDFQLEKLEDGTPGLSCKFPKV